MDYESFIGAFGDVPTNLAGELLYWQGYADAMEEAVSVINHDFDKSREDA